MKKPQNTFTLILNNQQGVALLMVMTAIVLLTTIMMTFSFDNNVNKIKAYNIEDKGQARLTAEAGLRFAMVRLKLYKEAFNYLEKNPSAKDFAKPQMLNSIWNFPFIYPIPVTDQMNQIQKDALKKFAENSLLEGELKLVISNISSRMNLNMLRVALMDAQNQNGQSGQSGQGSGGGQASDDDQQYNIQNQLIKSLNYSIETKSAKDDYFASLYMGVAPIELVNNLIVNISDLNSLADDGGATARFDGVGVTPKRAPLWSMTEVYSLPEWDDDLVELIKNEFTVYGAIMIDLNKITAKMLRLLIPNITDQEVKDFFQYRDNPDAPKFFNTLDDFKNYVTNIGTIMSSEDFDERIKKFKAKGIKFGPSPSLFKIISSGTKGRGTYTLEAYIVIPAKPYKPKTWPQTPEDPNGNGIPDSQEVPPTDNDVDGDGIPNDEDPVDNRSTAKVEQKVQLLEPRIVEIFIR